MFKISPEVEVNLPGYESSELPTAVNRKFLYDVHPIKSQFPDTSPGFRALIGLTAFNLAKTRDLSSVESAKEEISRELRNCLNLEYRYQSESKIPPIGLEIEIPLPKNTNISEELIQANVSLRGIGIPGIILNDFYEFQLPPSYSWATQARILAELVKGGYVPHFRDRSNKLRKTVIFENQPLYSVHCNLGTPSWFNNELNSDVQSYANEKTSNFAAVSGVAYSSAERLEKRKTKITASINKTAIDLETGEERPYGRIEMRTLGLGTAPSFSQLFELQMVTSALLESIKKEADLSENSELDQDWVNIWNNFEHNTKSCLGDLTEFRHLINEKTQPDSISQYYPDISSYLGTLIKNAAFDVHRLIGNRS